MLRSSVVFPHPLGPRRKKISPGLDFEIHLVQRGGISKPLREVLDRESRSCFDNRLRRAWKKMFHGSGRRQGCRPKSVYSDLDG